MACQHEEYKVISSPCPSSFCHNTSGINNLLWEWEYKKESGKVLKNDDETKDIFRVSHCRAPKIGDNEPNQNLKFK